MKEERELIIIDDDDDDHQLCSWLLPFFLSLVGRI
jgi:hypothetical protein